MKIISKDKNNLILNIASYFISNIIQRIRNKYEDFDKDSRYISEIIIDTKSKFDKDTAGSVTSNKINLFINNINNYQFTIFVILHEIGHNIRINNGLFNSNYNNISKNVAYYTEEIEANNYALTVIKKYFNIRKFKKIIEHYEENTNIMMNKINELQKMPNNYFTSYSLSYTNGSTRYPYTIRYF